MSISTGFIKLVAVALGELNQSAVFVGGATVPFYLPEEIKSEARPTEDIDVVLELVPKRKLHDFDDLLRKKGFQNDTSTGAPLCRWILGSIKVDIMTTDDGMLGFTNRWYADGVANATSVECDGMAIQILTLPFFLATKIEAFKGRGKGDFLLSHDIEDVITIIDAIDESQLKSIFDEGQGRVGAYLKGEFAGVVGLNEFEQAVAGTVRNRGLANERASQLIQAIKNHLQ